MTKGIKVTNLTMPIKENAACGQVAIRITNIYVSCNVVLKISRSKLRSNGSTTLANVSNAKFNQNQSIHSSTV